MAELPPPPEGIVLAHFIVSDDVERSRRFYTEVLGGRVVFSGPGGLTYVALSNTWIIINVGGGPTDDKPAVTLETPRDPDRVAASSISGSETSRPCTTSGAPGVLVPDAAETARIRDPCYLRDPDGHLIEVGQTTDPDRGLVARPLACEPVRPEVGGHAELTGEMGHTGPGAHAARTGTQRAGVPERLRGAWRGSLGADPQHDLAARVLALGEFVDVCSREDDGAASRGSGWSGCAPTRPGSSRWAPTRPPTA